MVTRWLLCASMPARNLTDDRHRCTNGGRVLGVTAKRKGLERGKKAMLMQQQNWVEFAQ